MTVLEMEVSKNPVGWVYPIIVLVAIGLAAVVAFRVDADLYSDVRADWLLATAVTQGIDSTSGLLEIAEQLDEDYQAVGIDEVTGEGRVHPRTPGMLSVLWPITLLPIDSVFALSVGLNVVLAFLLLVGVVPRAAGVSLDARSALVLSTAAIGFPMMSAIGFGTHSIGLALLVWVSILLVRRRDSLLGGMLIGISVVARVFPIGLILAAGLLGRKRAVWAALATGAGLTAFGMAVFSIGPVEMLGNLNLANEQWGGASFNGSVGVWLRSSGWGPFSTSVTLSVLAVMITFFWVRFAEGDAVLAAGGTLLVWILLSPLSWPHYDVLVIPLACCVAITGRLKASRVLAYLYLAVWALISTWAVGGSFEASPVTVVGIRVLLAAGVFGEARLARADMAAGKGPRPSVLLR